MFSLKRKIKDLSKRALRVIFEYGQRVGVDVLPRHFYSEIPDIQRLRRTTAWRAPHSMIGVDGSDPEAQMDFVEECCPPSIVEEMRNRSIHTTASERNGRPGYGPVEADFLFGFVATKRPRQIFQIGCGVSTAVCLAAAEYANYDPDLICVEPYPNDFLQSLSENEDIDLIRKKAENIDVNTVGRLGGGVLFFVDSSHTLGPAGEVTRIIAEMLPQLSDGAWVHFHDIKFPYDYDRHVLDSSLFFQHESALLLAFLIHNERFRILASQSMLHYSRPDALQEYLPNYEPASNEDGLNKGEGDFPSSTYLRVVK